METMFHTKATLIERATAQPKLTKFCKFRGLFAFSKFEGVMEPDLNYIL